jgi:hypothetical protein
LSNSKQRKKGGSFATVEGFVLMIKRILKAPNPQILDKKMKALG